MASFSKVMNTQDQSPLFKLPGELRNLIYEACLASNLKTDEAVDLTNLTTSVVPGAPDTGLLCTCQQLYSELIDSHHEASSAFRTRSFTITLRLAAFQNKPFAALSDAIIDRINKLEFVVRNRHNHVIASMAVKKPGINGPDVFSVGRTTGCLDANAAVASLVRTLEAVKKPDSLSSKRRMFEEMHDAVVVILRKEKDLRGAAWRMTRQG